MFFCFISSYIQALVLLFFFFEGIAMIFVFWALQGRTCVFPLLRQGWIVGTLASCFCWDWRYSSLDLTGRSSMLLEYECGRVWSYNKLMRAPKQVQALNINYQKYDQKHRKLAGETIGSYQIQGQIGSGSFGAVYRAQHIHSKQTYAIKILDLKELRKQQNPKTYEIKMRLSRTEAELMQVCDSQNLVKCFQVFENDDLKALVITFCNGEDLNQLVRKKKKIPQNEAILILKQIINGLAELHKHKIIHRDLKPENILSHDGVFKIADFGFSKELSINKHQEKMTTLGTISTMAPEVMNRQPYGLKADIWSIGIIFYFMLFGTYPYNYNLDEEKRKEQIKSNKFIAEEKLVSPNAIKFIRETLVATSQGRLDWSQVKSHKIFEEQDGKLAKSFQLDMEINIPKLIKSDYAEDKDEDQESAPVFLIGKLPTISQADSALEQICTENQKNPQKFQKISVETEELSQVSLPKDSKEERKRLAEEAQTEAQRKREKQRELQRGKIAQSQKRVQQYVQKQISIEESNLKFQLYYWAKKAYWECLKTEVIYTEIIFKIKEYNILSLSKREEVEMMYLISTRCLNNMSDINHQYEKHKDNVSVRSINNQVKHLYEKVVANWQIYSKELTVHEDKYIGRVGDFWDKLWNKDQRIKKDKFLTGIQVQNYTKDEQINYTYQNYISPLLSTLGKSNEVQRRLWRHMRAYKRICKLEGRDYGFAYFEETIAKILTD